MARRSGGFTLIEILCVLAVIAALAAIVFVVSGSAREKARSSTCLNNLQQIGVASLIYSQDYDGKFVRFMLLNPSGFYWWDDLLQPYLKDRRVTVCPSATPGVSHQQRRAPENDWLNGTKPICYAWNMLAPSFWTITPSFAGKTGFYLADCEAAVPDLAGTLWLVETDTKYTERNGTRVQCRTHSQLTGERDTDYGWKPVCCPQHAGGMNVLYGDRHAKWIRWGSTAPRDWSIQAD